MVNVREVTSRKAYNKIITNIFGECTFLQILINAKSIDKTK